MTFGASLSGSDAGLGSPIMSHALPPTASYNLGGPGSPTAFIPEPGDAQRSFAEILSIADRGPAARAPEPREIAETFVAVALVQPLLAEARKSTWAAPPFAPTQGEKQFGALMDAHVARDVTRAARFPLVERLAQQMRSG